MPLYLGIAGSAHALTAVVIETGRARRIVFERAIHFDRDLPEYGTVGGLQSHHDEAAAPLIADALDRLMGRLAAAAEIDVDDLRGIGGASTGDVADLRERVTALPRELDPSRPLATQLQRFTPQAAKDPHFGGYLSPYWQQRYALPPAPLVEWSDEPVAHTVGIGVVKPGTIGVALGTSDVVYAGTQALRFSNGALAREWVRLEYRLNTKAIAAIIETSPGNDGYIMLPWLEAETTPAVSHGGIRRFAFDRSDPARNVRALIEGQMMAMANHATGLTSEPIDRVIATGAGAGADDPSLLQVMANVFGADVYRLQVTSPVALGAALRAYHHERTDAGTEMSWSDTVRGFTDPNPAYRVVPNPRHVATYAALRREYAILERLHQHRRPIC
jgi:sugar (pentulose or hexulose) kinase